MWDGRRGCFWWTDIQQKRLHRLDWPSRELHSVAAPYRIGSLALTEATDRLLVAFEQGFAHFWPERGTIAWIATPPLPPGVRFNDGRVDRRGRFWAGTMVEDAAAAGAPDLGRLYRLEGQQAVPTLNGIAIANSLCWSPDGATMYFADSMQGAIMRHDFAGGEPGEATLFARTAPGTGPDGSTVDAAGRLWNAQWGASKVVAYHPSGEPLCEVTLPVSQPSCVAFGGDDLSILAVTTAWDGMAEDQRAAQPEAGNLFLFETSATGLAESIATN